MPIEPIVTPAVVVNGSAQVPTPPAATPDPVARIAELEKAVELNKREKIMEVRKWKGLTDAEKKVSAERTAEAEGAKRELAELKKRDQYAKLNPDAHLRSLFGDNYHEVLMTLKANGGAPTADTVAAEVARMREEFDGKLSERDRANAEAAKKAEAARVDSQLRQFHDSTAEWFDSAKKDYPALDAEGEGRHVAGIIFRFIKSEWERTFDPETGRGVALDMKTAADRLEEMIIARNEKVIASEKYAQRFREKLTPAKTSATVAPVTQFSRVEKSQSAPQKSSSKTLSNALTGSTPGEKPTIRSEEQRREAAIAALMNQR